MKTTQITIKDIARELNISPSTVSRALKNHPDISQETKKAVVELANKWEYQPNSIALSLRKSKTNTIGIVIPKIVHHFFSTVISGIEDVAYDEGYNIIITQSNESYHREMDCIVALTSSRVDGLFISLASEENDYEHIRHLAKKNIPLVFFDRACDVVEANKVLIDDYGGAFQATEHLIEQGCKDIVHLEGPDNLSISQLRMKGYMDALRHHQIPIREEYIIKSDNRLSGYQTIKEFIYAQKQIDGVFTANDDTALGVMKAIKETGKKIGDEIAVIGFGDDPIDEIIEPQLSSVSQPGFEMGQTVAHLFFDEITKSENSETHVPETKILPTKLVLRESSKRNR